MDVLSLQGDATDKDVQTIVNAQLPSFAETWIYSKEMRAMSSE